MTTNLHLAMGKVKSDHVHRPLCVVALFAFIQLQDLCSNYRLKYSTEVCRLVEGAKAGLHSSNYTSGPWF
jgi:hypothetical protein